MIFELNTRLPVKMNEQYQKMEKEKTEAELAYLKTQVNPHFLFNTLNTIYAMALEQSPATADAIAKLSGIMRYVLKESSNGFISLGTELDCISNYIDLQHERFGNSVNIEYKATGQPGATQIAPLFLLPFIENAFKHGINPERDSRVAVTINISGDMLKMHVENTIVPIATQEPKSGLGIANTQKRLEHQYPGKHTLAISQQNDIFIVDLTIHLS
jgi:LytS/YehU family sensor histidine kinase